MGAHATVANSYMEKIQYYHDHGGASGYSEALYYFRKLSELTVIIPRSKIDSGDDVVVQKYIKTAAPLMVAMEERQKEASREA